jgi:hypothetical protein
MLDPSLFLDPVERPYEGLEGGIYLPKSALRLSIDQVDELASFFGIYIPNERLHFGYETYTDRLSRISWKEFSGTEFINLVPQELLHGYHALQEAEIPDTIRLILIDEFVFLTTQSCLLSRLKKIFKSFEKLDVLPLINLEEWVPQEWAKPVRGMKKCASWIGFIVGSFMVGPGFGVKAMMTIEGARLVIIDPP